MTYSGLHFDELRKQQQLESWQQSEEQNVPLGYGLANAVEGGIQRGVGWLQEQAEDDPDTWTDDALRLMGGGLKNISNIPGMGLIGKVGEAGGYVGGGIAEMMGVDRRIGGFVGSMAADAALGAGVGKVAQIGKTTARLRRLRYKGAPDFAIEAAATGKYSFAYGDKPVGLLDDIGTAAKTTKTQRRRLGILEDQTLDPLKQRARLTAEEVGVGQKYAKTGVGDYNPDEAKAVQKLITQSLQGAEPYIDNVRASLLQEVTGKSTANMTIGEIKKGLRSRKLSEKSIGIRDHTQKIKRGLNDFLQSDPKYLHKIGVIKQILDDPTLLHPENIGKWAQSVDARISGSKKGIAFHHQVLSSPQDLLHPGNVDAGWRKQFLKLLDDKFEGTGSASIVKQDIAAHKPFTPPKDARGVVESNKWNVKGILGDVLKEHTDFPLSSDGVKILKEIGDKGNYAKGFEGQVQKVIRTLEQKATHAPWSNMNKGWALDKRLGKYPPQQAFEVAEALFDMERVAAAHGVELTTKLRNWKKRISKGTFGKGPNVNMEEAIADLQKILDKTKVPDIVSMEAEYKRLLNALLKGGIPGLEQAKLPKAVTHKLKHYNKARSRLKID